MNICNEVNCSVKTVGLNLYCKLCSTNREVLIEIDCKSVIINGIYSGGWFYIYSY